MSRARNLVPRKVTETRWRRKGPLKRRWWWASRPAGIRCINELSRRTCEKVRVRDFVFDRIIPASAVTKLITCRLIANYESDLSRAPWSLSLSFLSIRTSHARRRVRARLSDSRSYLAIFEQHPGILLVAILVTSVSAHARDVVLLLCC